jgi:titin
VDFLALAAPAPPAGLQAQLAQPREVLLTWQDTSSDESGFRIESSRAGGPFTEVHAVGPNAASALIGGLARSTSYVFRVRAHNSVGASDYSNQAPITTPGAPPRPPKRLRAALQSGTEVRLTWRDASPDELGFKIETAPKGGTFAQIATVGADVTTFTAEALAPGVMHRFRVRAYNAGGDSRYSNTAKRKTP